jgi:hypothetical protein
MTERLPITIEHSNELLFILNRKINSVISKLEAQLNFQTMMANWYNDENDVISINLHLYTPNEFSILRESYQQKHNFSDFSDDVFSMTAQESPNSLTCHIAITKKELELLIQQPKLQSPLLSAKLNKVLTLIARQLNYPELSK